MRIGVCTPTPSGDADHCEYKGFARRGICKHLKIKRRVSARLHSCRHVERHGGIPHPPVFGKRGCKLLIVKGGGVEKRAKRRQLLASKGVRLMEGATGGYLAS